ncbi:MAG: tetratricopeptide repeat protein, partial [Alphaproteobacteria bacterium]|nr:tetratricopeptide repeat protein [Alphaproteobacteria bacterium]
MLTDALGNPVSTDHPEALRAIDAFGAGFLGYTTALVDILKGAQADPHCAVAQALSGVLFLFLESADGPPRAAPHIAAARAAVARGTEREKMLVSAVECWARGEIDKSIAIFRGMADAYPRDLVANKLGQYHAFNRGDLAGMLDLVERILPANADNHFVHGMHAFGLEQANRLTEAEAAGRRAVAMDRRDPWAHHAVAHVLDTQGRIAEGIVWMNEHADTWEGCNSFMLTHNWWHVALYLIDAEDFEGPLALYDRVIWCQDKTYSQDQVNAASLLWRLELRGVDVGERWGDLAGHVEGRTGDHVLPFLDLHYIYALARAGRDAKVAEFMDRLRAHAAATPDAVWRDVAVTAVEGVLAHARKRYAEAGDRLGRVQPRLQELGGSHAQRDLFVQTWIDSLLREGRGGSL